MKKDIYSFTKFIVNNLQKRLDLYMKMSYILLWKKRII
jgi:hypothetical protein